MNHTSGPLRVVRRKNGELWILNEKDLCLATVYDGPEYFKVSGPANAALFSAAPDMYEALKGPRHCYCHCCGFLGGSCDYNRVEDHTCRVCKTGTLKMVCLVDMDAADRAMNKADDISRVELMTPQRAQLQKEARR